MNQTGIHTDVSQIKVDAMWCDVILLVALASPALIFLLGSLIEHHSILMIAVSRAAGDELTTTPNYIRNVLELASFVSGPALFVTAVLAFVIAIRQTRESENTRVANLYSTIEERWASQQIRDSLTRIYDIAAAYNSALSQTKAEYFDVVLSGMSYRSYIRTLGILDFFEYIGMMVDGGYIKVRDVSKLMRSSIITIHDLMLIHMDRLRVIKPDAYAMFTILRNVVVDK